MEIDSIMNMKKRAFTLTELLVSLAIIGTIAVFAIPPLMNDIHTRVYLNMVKNMSVTIEELAADQMLNRRVRNLSDTDFGNADEILSTKHFAIVKKENGILTSTYKNFSNEDKTIDGIDGKSALLKNGVVLVYAPLSNSATATGTFIMDANGNDGPNVIGKDLFVFNITKKGKIVSGTEDTSLATCSAGNPRSCYGYIVTNGWKYPN